ncbi:NAD(P)/FAD-dependent oxidoreductase [Echinimonas agarilytica]|uniref:FAD-dependent oxidoreductase n=1 Tax=Echinimonas agarilytica TaxID=1215918 RepID=A0AA41WB99_9GAMM|nr:FAD-dependent oxidoreductase [Echinimonas agarilytica]MCM2681403.1 FAD-dependent oxidoreductase [Echinimonas agarilytica]
MTELAVESQTCVIVGASHGGVNAAFALRKEGWEGRIVLVDADPALPYHRPPLSKAFLTSSDDILKLALKPEESYNKANIDLLLGHTVTGLSATVKTIELDDGTALFYDKLILATGARPFIPPINGLDTARDLYPLRTAQDVENIRRALQQSEHKRAVIIGGGYIGLETAASMKKLGASVTVLERESRILARVTSPEMSEFFDGLHSQHGVAVDTDKNVVRIRTSEHCNTVVCEDGTEYVADIIVVGVGIRVNTQLAEVAKLTLENGIQVDDQLTTSDKNIFAIGDCCYHFNPTYERHIRLESVQNAVDQAKVVAANICGKNRVYDTVPWFWSDQYDVKLQMVGLPQGYTECLIRQEDDDSGKFSAWYFQGERLLAVDAINHAKAYVVGTKFIASGRVLDKHKLADKTVEFKPANFLA